MSSQSRWTTSAVRTLSQAAMSRVTAAYALLLVVVSITLTTLGPRARENVVSQMSTNLHNLGHGHLETLVGSAFVSDGDAVWSWLPALVCLLALGELTWGSRGLVLAFAVGHIGATLIVAVGLAAALKAGWVPVAVAHATDVGISYGAVGVLGALTASVPPRWRPLWIGWWLGTTAAAASSVEFTAIGHTVALLLGMGLSFRLPSIERWTPLRCALLASGSTLGLFMVSDWAIVPPVVGLTAALFAYLVGNLRSSGRDALGREDFLNTAKPATATPI